MNVNITKVIKDILTTFTRMSLDLQQSQMRIRIFSDFCESIGAKVYCEKIFETDLMEEYGNSPEKKIFITTDDDYTHAIIWNKAMPVLLPSVSKENVIGLAYEPPDFLEIKQEFINYAQQYIGKYFIGDVGNLPEPFIGGKAFLIHMAPLKTIPSTKTRLMSIMVSEKKNAPGHNYRHELVKEILKTNLPIDIYGRGCPLYNMNDNRVKGGFEEKELYEDYKFHICIENFQTSYYYSEKIINPLLCGTIPIYLGCKNMDKSLSESTHLLTGNLSQDMAFISHVIHNPDNFIKQIDVDSVKKDTNLLRNLDSLF
jgi:hypothetical protein